MALIRRAVAQDAPALTEVGRVSFTETFGHLYPPQDLNDYLHSAHTDEAYARWIANSAYGVWVAESGGQLVGYALTGPCDLPHAEVTQGCGELKRLYLLEKAHNQGIGGQLLKTCLDDLTRPGRRLWIGVWSENHGAQRLYGRHGFVKVGEYEFPVGTSRDHEFILSRPV
jgi:ribosomal protein S18 acetylase RimI-like enzyme